MRIKIWPTSYLWRKARNSHRGKLLEESDSYPLQWDNISQLYFLQTQKNKTWKALELDQYSPASFTHPLQYRNTYPWLRLEKFLIIEVSYHRINKTSYTTARLEVRNSWHKISSNEGAFHFLCDHLPSVINWEPVNCHYAFCKFHSAATALQQFCPLKSA